MTYKVYIIQVLFYLKELHPCIYTEIIKWCFKIIRKQYSEVGSDLGKCPEVTLPEIFGNENQEDNMGNRKQGNVGDKCLHIYSLSESGEQLRKPVVDIATYPTKEDKFQNSVLFEGEHSTRK